ncbi:MULTISPECIES: DUF6381 family protein [unclassified Streptomyces]|uniref:DUF6381 family protein n=1 Tax=unclassified Streptomyces TaxID=2593676 RepID=UPI002E1952E0
MSPEKPSHGSAEDMKQQAQKMEQAAEQSSDPHVRRRLREKATELRRRTSRQQGEAPPGDFHPKH